MGTSRMKPMPLMLLCIMMTGFLPKRILAMHILLPFCEQVPVEDWVIGALVKLVKTGDAQAVAMLVQLANLGDLAADRFVLAKLTPTTLRRLGIQRLQPSTTSTPIRDPYEKPSDDENIYGSG